VAMHTGSFQNGFDLLGEIHICCWEGG
jgi:hypothetical protein